MTATTHMTDTTDRAALRALESWRSDLRGAEGSADVVRTLVGRLPELAQRLDPEGLTAAWRTGPRAPTERAALDLAVVAGQLAEVSRLLLVELDRLSAHAGQVAAAPEPGALDLAVVEAERADRERWTDAPDRRELPPQWSRVLAPVGDNERASAATALGAVIKLDPHGVEMSAWRTVACVELGPEVADAVSTTWRLLSDRRTARRVRAIAERISGGEK